jgi:hypothetical protein
MGAFLLQVRREQIILSFGYFKGKQVEKPEIRI